MTLPFIQLQLNRTCYSFVYLIEISAQCFTQRCTIRRCKPALWNLLLATVERSVFSCRSKDIPAHGAGDGTAGCFKYIPTDFMPTTRFSQISVILNTVSAADFVQLCQQSNDSPPLTATEYSFSKSSNISGRSCLFVLHSICKMCS